MASPWGLTLQANPRDVIGDKQTGHVSLEFFPICKLQLLQIISKTCLRKTPTARDGCRANSSGRKKVWLQFAWISSTLARSRSTSFSSVLTNPFAISPPEFNSLHDFMS